MIRGIVLTGVLVALAGCGTESPPPPVPEGGQAAPLEGQEAALTARAVAAAEPWLALVDAGRYRRSWAEAAPVFREALTADEWARQVGDVRKSLGELRSRELLSSEYMTALPDGSRGEFVLIQYSSAFERQPEAVETVVLARTEEGAWRVAGYFIRPA